LQNILLFSLGRNGGLPKYAKEIEARLHARAEPPLSLYARSSEHPIEGGVAVPTYGDVPTLLLSSLTVLPLLLLYITYLVMFRGIRVFYFPYIHTWTPVLALLGRMLGVRVVVTIHDYRPHLGEDGILVRLILGISFRLAHGSIFLTEHVRHDALSSRPAAADGSIVIPHGLFSLPGLVEKTEADIRERLGLILFIGRVSKYKGIDLLLEAFARCPLRDSVRLLVAGKANYEIGEEALPANVEVIDKFLAEQEMAELINQADLIVLPYREATQSGVLTLAVASSTPLVVTNLQGLREQLEENEAIFCEPEPASLAAALASAADADRRREICRALACKKHALDWEVIAGRVAEFCAQEHRSAIRSWARALISPASMISLIIFMSMVLGFGRDLLVAYYFGAGWHADLYFVALIIPLFFENSLASSLRDVLVSVFIRKREEDGTAYRRLAAQIGLAVILLSIVIMVVFGLTARFWLGVLDDRWITEHGDHVMVAYTIGIAMIPLLLWSYFQTSLCHTEGWFVLPAWRGVFFNLGGIVLLWLFWRSIEGLLLGMLAGQLMHAFLLQRQLKLPSVGLPSRETRAEIAAFLPRFTTLVSVALLMQLGISMERLLATWTGTGELARLSYAFRIVTVPLVLITFSVVGIAYARFAHSVATNDERALRQAIVDACRLCLYFLVPTAVTMFVFADALLGLLLHRGAFDQGDVQSTAQLMRIYALGLPAMGMALLLTRLLAALGASRALLAGTFLSVLALCAGYLAVYDRGIAGLATVTSIGALLQSVILWRLLPAHLRSWPSRQDLVMLAVSILLLLVILKLVAGNGLANLLAGGVVTVAVPVLVALCMGLRQEITGSFTRILGRRK
jgi:murein biosynthesis integral membrane protein MurJ